MSETMTASERANWRIRWLTWTARENATEDAKAQVDQQSAALLACVARLEAVVAAARETIANHYGPFADIKKALAALDRPEDGEA